MNLLAFGEILAESEGWLSAQDKDCEFISTYARDNPIREDVADDFEKLILDIQTRELV